MAGGNIELPVMKNYFVNKNERIIIPPNTNINGNGSTIYFNVNDDLDNNDTNIRCLCIVGDNVTIQNINIVGEHVLENGWLNYENNAIWIDANVTNTHIHNCNFYKLSGFPIHSPINVGGGIVINNCYFEDCANGVNVNISNSEIYNNTFVRSEGIEVAASNVNIHDNVYAPALGGAISIGGAINGTPLTNIRVYNENIIDSIPSNNSTGFGIIIADGCDNAEISFNNINTEGHGINFTQNGSNLIDGTFINNNTINSGNGNYGIRIPSNPNIKNTIVENNIVGGNKNSYTGILSLNPSVVISNNDFRNSGVGSGFDVILTEDSSGCVFDDNNLYNTIQDDRL